MANIDHLMNEEDIPKDWEPIETPRPSVAAAPPQPNPMSNYFQGSLPPTTQHDTSFVGTEVGTPMVPKTSLMPLSPQSNAFTNAAAASTAQTVAQQVVSDAQLQISQFNHGINANSRTQWTGNGQWAPKTDVTSIEVDFGFQIANEGDDAIATVTGQDWVAADSIIICSAAMVATADHDPDDVWAERIVAYATNIVPGVGFDIVATSANEGGRTFGKYIINIVGY